MSTSEQPNEGGGMPCAEPSPLGFICTLRDCHGGEHVATAGGGRVVDQWPPAASSLSPVVGIEANQGDE